MIKKSLVANLLLCFFVGQGVSQVQAIELQVKVSRIRYLEKPIYIRVDRVVDEGMERNELPKEALIKIKLTPAKKSETISLGQVSAGQYVVSIFQDLNNNEIMDTNKKNRPTEPYGLSNNPILFETPALSDLIFEVSDEAKLIDIYLRQKKQRLKR